MRPFPSALKNCIKKQGLLLIPLKCFRIYEKQAIRKMKVYNILKIGFPLTELPLFDDHIRICAAFFNLKPPLCE